MPRPRRRRDSAHTYIRWDAEMTEAALSLALRYGAKRAAAMVGLKNVRSFWQTLRRKGKGLQAAKRGERLL